MYTKIDDTTYSKELPVQLVVRTIAEIKADIANYEEGIVNNTAQIAHLNDKITEAMQEIADVEALGVTDPVVVAVDPVNPIRPIKT